jgi:hypothetical protein
MAGALLERELTQASLQFIQATAEHDELIRRLLRENPIPGEVSFSFEHEPSYLKVTHGLGDDRTILALENNKLLCMGRCITRHHYINGKSRRVGYLGELRLDSSVQGRFDILRRGYKFFGELHKLNPLDFYFTSISEDNQRSIRFLERKLPGMPHYEFLTNLSTFLIPVPKSRLSLARISNRLKKRLASHKLRAEQGKSSQTEQVMNFLNHFAKRHQLTSQWNHEDFLRLSSLGLQMEDFQMIFAGPKLVACCALWDQRSFKQTVIRDYGKKTRVVKPWFDLLSKAIGVPGLPAIGSALSFACLSPLAMEVVDKELFFSLVESCLLRAARRNLEFIVVSLPNNAPYQGLLAQKISVWEYKTRIYGVQWENHEIDPDRLDPRPFFPEVAFL